MDLVVLLVNTFVFLRGIKVVWFAVFSRKTKQPCVGEFWCIVRRPWNSDD